MPLTGQSHAVAHKGGDRKVAMMNCYAWDGPGTLGSWVKMVGDETTLVHVAVCAWDSLRYLAAGLA